MLPEEFTEGLWAEALASVEGEPKPEAPASDPPADPPEPQPEPVEAPVEEAPAPIEEASPESPAPVEPDLKAQIAALEAKLAQYEASRVTREELTDAAKAAIQAAQPAPILEPTPEERQDLAAIEEFVKEYPDTARAVQALIKAAVRDVVAPLNKRMDDSIQQVSQAVQPALTTAAQVALQQRQAAIKAAHPDFEEVASPVVEWAKNQPPELRNSYLRILFESGDVDSINGVISQFKATRPVQTPPAPSASTSNSSSAPASNSSLASPTSIEKKATVRDVLKTMESVSSRPSPANSADVDPDDFATLMPMALDWASK